MTNYLSSFFIFLTNGYANKEDGTMDNTKNKISTSSKPITFEQIGREWLSKKELKVKTSTYNKYKNLLEKHIFPEFGTLQVTEYDIYSFENGLQKITYQNSNNFSKSTLKSIVYLLRAIIKYSLRFGLDSVIEFDFDITDSNSKNIGILSKKDEESLISYLCENHSFGNLGILLSLTTGLRIGEVCALRRKNVNFETNLIYICETAQRLQFENGTQLITTPPKSSKAYRYVPLPQIARTYLEQLNIKNVSEDAYILTNTTIPFEPRTLQYTFKSTLKKCSIENINFHALRHTFATNCVELGFDIKTLSELLGHSSVSFTLNRYVHSSITHKMQQMKLLDSWYGSFAE